MPESRSHTSSVEYGLQSWPTNCLRTGTRPDNKRPTCSWSRNSSDPTFNVDAYQLSRAPGLEGGQVGDLRRRGAAGAPGAQRAHAEPRRLDAATAWRARFLNASLHEERTIDVSGEANVGESTLVNALINFLPQIERLRRGRQVLHQQRTVRVAGRSFTVQLEGKQALPTGRTRFQKAKDIKSWLMVSGRLSAGTVPTSSKFLAAGSSGLATGRTLDPEATMADWMSHEQEHGRPGRGWS